MVSNSYQFTHAATKDLDDILAYLSINLANPNAAKKLYEDLFSKIDLICAFPESNEIVNNEFINRRDVRKALINNYVAYYIYDKDKHLITILRIIYSKRNLEEIIKLL